MHPTPDPVPTTTPSQHFQTEHDPSQLPDGNFDAHLAARGLRLLALGLESTLASPYVGWLFPESGREEGWGVPTAMSLGRELPIPPSSPGKRLAGSKKRAV